MAVNIGAFISRPCLEGHTDESTNHNYAAARDWNIGFFIHFRINFRIILMTYFVNSC